MRIDSDEIDYDILDEENDQEITVRSVGDALNKEGVIITVESYSWILQEEIRSQLQDQGTEPEETDFNGLVELHLDRDFDDLEGELETDEEYRLSELPVEDMEVRGYTVSPQYQKPIC